jgi:hypothetical protein
LKIPAVDCRELLSALLAERDRLGLGLIPVRDGLGTEAVAASAAPDALDEPEDREPTVAERSGLAVGSLPSRWLALTANAQPRRTRFIDGVSMLLELALLGLLDAPSGEVLVVFERRLGRPTPDGAADRVARNPAWATPGGTAYRLGPYVRALRPPDRMDAVAVSVRQAMMGRHLPDLRTGLLVWLVRMDYDMKRVAFPVVFDGAPRQGRKAVFGWRPSLDLDLDPDPEAVRRALRVLRAMFKRDREWWFPAG